MIRVNLSCQMKLVGAGGNAPPPWTSKDQALLLCKAPSLKYAQDLVFQGHLHSPQPDPTSGVSFLVWFPNVGKRYVDIGSTAPWVCYSPSSAQHVLGTSPTADSSTSCWLAYGVCDIPQSTSISTSGFEPRSHSSCILPC